jgi:undecaprenyl-diphosphatase
MKSRAAKLAVVASCVLLALAATSERLLEVDFDVTEWFRMRSGSTNTSVALLLTTLGSGYGAMFFLAIAVIVLGIKRWWDDVLFLTIAVGGGLVLDGPLKDLFDRPRPSFANPTIVFPGTSFPSGHAMTATILWGGLLMIVLERVTNPLGRVCALAGAVGIVGVVAVTRVYLGAHYLTDVLGGIAFGLLWLSVCDAAVGAVAKRKSV